MIKFVVKVHRLFDCKYIILPLINYKLTVACT